MAIVKGILQEDAENTVAIITEIGVIPFPNEGAEINQDVINQFNDRSLKLDVSKWYVLTDNEKSDYYDVSDNYFL